METVGTKFYNRADKISASISKAFGSLQGAISKVQNTASSLPGIDKFAGPNPPTLPSFNDIKNKASAALPPLPAPVPAADENPTPPTAPPSPPAPSAPPADMAPSPAPSAPPADMAPSKTAFPPVKAGAKKGGRRSTRGRRVQKKRRTHKRHRRN